MKLSKKRDDSQKRNLEAIKKLRATPALNIYSAPEPQVPIKESREAAGRNYYIHDK